MRERLAPRLAWSLWVATIAVTLASLPLRVLNGGDPVPSGVAVGFGFGFSTVGAIVASQRPRNLIGWLFCLISLAFSVAGFAQQYATRAFITAPGSLPGAVAMAWILQWVLWFAFPAGIALVLLLFPDGRPPSPRWSPVAWMAVACALLMVIGSMFEPGQLTDALHNANTTAIGYGVVNPVGMSALGTLPRLLALVGRVGAWLVLVVSAVGLIWRLIRARGDERQQLKWIAYVGAGITGLILAMLVLQGLGQTQLLGIAFSGVLVGILFGIPAAAGIAILKHRLYDIDVVISKTLLFGTLAAFITAVYVLIVVGIGALVGTGGRPNLALSILATAVVAVAFEPVREWAQRAANRTVYGKRATPYEVLSRFSERVAGAYSSDEILPRMARVLAEGTGAASATVWMKIDQQLLPAASWPDGAPTPAAELSERVAGVRHQGELLGELRVSKRAGEPLSPVEEKLLADLASQAGLVLRNVRLTTELQARLKEISEQAVELRASRQRIVAAQDAERRRLERNIHDGAQQHLVALAVKLRLAGTLAKRDSERAKGLLAELRSETAQTLQTLQDLARGIYPPLLREQGLAAALQAQGGWMDLPVGLKSDGVRRYAPEAEAAVYFCCLEALQNVAKHAHASSVRMHLREANGNLDFSVRDDGIGFDPDQAPRGSGLQNMADRLEAVGGKLEIHGRRGAGTTVSGRIPVRALESME